MNSDSQEFGAIYPVRNLLNAVKPVAVCKRLLCEDEGLELVEYALLAVLIVVALVASYAALPTPVNQALQTTSGVFP